MLGIQSNSYKSIKKVTSASQPIKSKHFAKFLLSYFKQSKNTRCYTFGKRTLREVADLVTVVQKPITPSNLSLQQVCGLLKLLNASEFKSACKNSLDLANLPRIIQDGIFKDLEKNYTDQ